MELANNKISSRTYQSVPISVISQDRMSTQQKFSPLRQVKETYGTMILFINIKLLAFRFNPIPWGQEKFLIGHPN